MTTHTTTHEPTAVGTGSPYAPESAEGGTTTQPGALAALCAAGSVRLFRQRASGSLRALPYLCPGTHARETAEYLADLVDDGASVAAAATATGLSRASVRRALANLSLAEDIEDGLHGDTAEPDLTALVFAGDADEEDES